MINVTIWNEFRHEKTDEAVKAIYPDGLHEAIKTFLDIEEDINVKTATLDEPEHGLTDQVLNHTDVLLWWGHVVLLAGEKLEKRNVCGSLSQTTQSLRAYQTNLS